MSAILCRTVDRFHSHGPLAPEAAPRFVQGNTHQPGAELRLRAKTREMVKSLQECLLCDVLRIGLVLHV